MIIYLLYCTVSHKGYVGQTTQSLRERWAQHCRSSRVGSPFSIHEAIREYGKDAFEISILETTDNLEELNALEIEQIKKQNTLSPNGYNLNSGGKKAMRLSEETRAKISVSHLGKRFEHSAETRKKMSAARMGRRTPEETKTKLRIASQNMSSDAKERVLRGLGMRWANRKAS